MVSFKLKLVASFVLLTLLPLGAAFWGYESLVHRSETRRADARLQAELRAAENAYREEVLALGRAATRLASDPAFQRALRDRDRRALDAYVAASPHLSVRIGRGGSTGTGRDEVVRAVDVFAQGKVLGQVVFSIELDQALLEQTTRRAGLESSDRLVLVRGGRVQLGPRGLTGESLPLRTAEPGSVTIDGTRYRVLTAPTLTEPKGVSFAVLTPQSTIDSVASGSQRALLVALAALLALGIFAAYLLSRSIVGTLRGLAAAAEGIAHGRLGERVPVRGRDEFGQLARAFNEMAAQLEARLVELESERSRLNRATVRIGDALAATHDPEQLLGVILETAVEATDAYGGIVRDAGGGEVVKVGDPEAGLQKLELPLQAGRRSFGTLVLAGPHFGEEERETAISLAGQAVIALENARLHRIVERQALVDGLTSLANRRSGEDTLRSELSRVERFGGELAVVLADLDGFKDVNDRYGHPFGDLVLREFARRLQENVREIDTASRWGGEEFCLVLPGTDAPGAARVAERARAALAGTPIEVPDGTQVTITASFGVAAFPGHGGERELVDAADAALYEAKRTGKNRVVTAAEPVAQRADV